MNSKHNQLYKYLTTLQYPKDLTPWELRFIKNNYKKYYIQNKKLYKKTKRASQLVINPEQALEVMQANLTEPLGGHLAYQATQPRSRPNITGKAWTKISENMH